MQLCNRILTQEFKKKRKKETLRLGGDPERKLSPVISQKNTFLTDKSSDFVLHFSVEIRLKVIVSNISVMS